MTDIYLNEEQCLELINALERVRDGVRDDEGSGICWNVDDLLPHWEEFSCSAAIVSVEVFSLGWEHHSGDDMYPIPAQYNRHVPKWTGVQGEMRMSLIAHLIQNIKANGTTTALECGDEEEEEYARE